MLPQRMRNQLLVPLALILVPMLVVYLAIFARWRHTQTDAEIRTNLEMAHAVGAMFSAFVQDVIRQETIFGLAMQELGPKTPAPAQTLLRRVQTESPLFRSMNWISPEGVILESSDPKAVGLNLADREHIRTILEGKNWSLSNLLIDRAGGDWRFYIACAVRSSEGTLEGILSTAINRAYLNDLFRSLPRAEEGRTTLFDRTGRLVYSSEIGRIADDGPPKLDDLIQQMFATGTETKGRYASVYDATWRYGARTPVACLGWVAGASRPVLAAQLPIMRDLLTSMGVLAVVVLLSLLAALRISRRIAGSARLLEEHAAKVGGGDLAHRVAIPEVREFDAVASGLNRMAENLRLAQERDRYLAEVIEEAEVPFATGAADGRVILFNAAFARLTGYTREDLEAGPLTWTTDLTPPEWRALEAAQTAQAAATRKAVRYEKEYLRKDGARVPVELLVQPEFDADGALTRYRAFATDIIERRRKEADLHRLNRTLQAVSRGNLAMMRATNETEYIEEVCRVVVEDCGRAMVWIGYAEDDEEKQVRPVAHSGFEEGYIESLNITWSDTDRGRGPTGTAIRTGQRTVCRNMLTDPAFAPWRAAKMRSTSGWRLNASTARAPM
jgi:PAS domain S-box-containing protein